MVLEYPEYPEHPRPCWTIYPSVQSLALGLHEHKGTAGSWAACCSPGLTGPSPQSIEPETGPQPLLVHGVFLPQGKDPEFASFGFQKVLFCPSV